MIRRRSTPTLFATHSDESIQSSPSTTSTSELPGTPVIAAAIFRARADGSSSTWLAKYEFVKDVGTGAFGQVSCSNGVLWVTCGSCD